MFHWLTKRRRQKLLATPLPPAWPSYLAQVGYCHFLSPADQDRLRDAARIFVAEKTWEGCGGLILTEKIQVQVATLASVLTLGFADFYFDNVHTILIYPSEFETKKADHLSGYAYLEGTDEVLGEHQHRGPIRLSWKEIQEDLQEPGCGSNVVFHEFAHALDMLNGDMDGVPKLAADMAQRWQEIMAREFASLCQSADRDEETLLDPYGAEDPAEFFAVATECFFDLPGHLRNELPELYDLLRDFYCQDPASWRHP